MENNSPSKINIQTDEERTNLSLDLIISSKNNLETILREISSIKIYEEDDLERFDRFVFINKKYLNNLILENILEIYMKILVCSVDCDSLLLKNNTGFFYKCINSNHKRGYVVELAMSKMKEEDDSRMCILSYILCINHINEEYKGKYEIFYIIEYLYKEYKEDDTIDETILNWAINSKVEYKGISVYNVNTFNKGVLFNKETPLFNKETSIFDNESPLFNVECRDFFEKRLMKVQNIQKLLKIIETKSSYKLLYAVLDKFISRLDIVYNLIVNMRPSEENSLFFLEKILLKINDENFTKKLILNTGICINAFFIICKKIDMKFMQCINICINYASDEILMRMMKDERFIIESNQGFKKMIEVINRTEEIDEDNFTRRLLNINGKSLRFPDRRMELLSRIEYMINNCKKLRDSPEILKRVMNIRGYPERCIEIAFKIRSFKLFKKIFKSELVRKTELKDESNKLIIENKLMEKTTELITENKSLKKSNLPEKTTKLMEKSNLPETPNELLKWVIKGLKRREYSVFYYKVMDFIIKTTVNKINNESDFIGLLDDSPYSNVILSKLSNKHKIYALKNIPEDGLYFNNSKLIIKNTFKKFILSMHFILFENYIKDMAIISFLNKDDVTIFSLNIEDSHFVFIQNDMKTKLDHSIENSVTEKLDLIFNDKKFNFSFLNLNFNFHIDFIHSIKIDEDFYGCIKGLFYAETTEIEPKNFTVKKEEDFMKERRDFLERFLIPIERLLIYKNRKGMLIDNKGTIFLGKGNEKDLIMKNIIN